MKRLSGWDAFLLYTETPNVHMHTLKIAVIDVSALDGRAFGIEEFRQVIGERMYKLEPFRYQLVDIPMKFHHPMWRENCQVDLQYHIRPWRVAAPGGRRELDEAVGQIAGTPLDRNRPLWEMYFVEGLQDNRIAVVGKVHHALADGVASANLLARSMDLWDESPDAGDHTYATDPAPNRGQLMRSAWADHLHQLRKLPDVLKYTAAGMTRVRNSTRKLSPQLTRPFTPPPSFMNHVLTAERRFATATLSLAEIKETARKLGVTLNDLVLAMSSGALRELLLKYDGTAEHPLLASVPMSFDFSAHRISGNRFSGVLVGLPVDVPEVGERVRRARESAVLAKESHQLVGPELVARWAAYMPPAPIEWMFRWLANQDGQNKVLNLNISNVPGPRERGQVGAAVITEIYSVGPLTAGSGLNITVWSYVDQLNISVLSDTRSVDDPHEVTGAMLADFSKVRELAGLSPELSVVDTALPN